MLHYRIPYGDDPHDHYALRGDGAPGGDRTHNLRLRRPTLYPIELQARTYIPDPYIETGAECTLMGWIAQLKKNRRIRCFQA